MAEATKEVMTGWMSAEAGEGERDLVETQLVSPSEAERDRQRSRAASRTSIRCRRFLVPILGSETCETSQFRIVD